MGIFLSLGGKIMIQTSCAQMLMRGKVVANVESCVFLQRVSNTCQKAITLDVEMEDYYRIKGDRTND